MAASFEDMIYIELCTPFVPSSYTTRDCFTFVSKLKSLTCFKHCIMASMDVESLFTNVPVSETITIITDIIFKDTEVFNGFNKQQFTKLLCLAVQDNVFTFNNKLFKQVDGVAMGSPLGPLFANFFLGYLEEKYFTECIEFKPSFYVRYVDDTFALFNDKDHIEQFVAYLNTWHKNLKFTYEIEHNLVLSFIGVKIIKTVTGFMSSIYYKQTHTGLYTNFCSNLPDSYKKGAFTGLLSRIYSISSNWSIINDEFTKLRKMFVANCYPSHLLDNCINQFLSKTNYACDKTNVKRKPDYFVSLPFYGIFMLKYRNELRRTVKKYFPNINVSFVFTVPCRLHQFFNVKDATPVDILSNIIYKFQCSSCNAIYVGKTDRHFYVRKNEHLGTSYRTGSNITIGPRSTIMEHLVSNSHTANQNNFSVLYKCNNSIDTGIIESLLISKLKPCLNSGTSLALNIFNNS